MPIITWSNGTSTEATTWQELLNLVRKVQWHYYDEPTFREVMAKRCLRWSGTTINPHGTPRQFFHELERAHLITFGVMDDGKPE